MINITQEPNTKDSRLRDLKQRLKYKTISKDLYSKALSILEKGYSIQYYLINDIVKEIKIIK
jgi:hypothetical protein